MMKQTNCKMVFNQEFTFSNKYIDKITGYLVNENVPIARAGIFKYKGFELGLVGADANREITVYRPLSVFTAELLKQFDALDLTNDHPIDGVNSKNFRFETVGSLAGSAFMQGDDAIAEKIIVKDVNAIEDVETAGKKELSIGFNANYEWTPGVTEDGEEYEGIEIITAINHISIVDEGKAGPKYRLNSKLSNQEEVKAMTTLVKRVHNGVTIEMNEQSAEAYDHMKSKADGLETTKNADSTEIKDCLNKIVGMLEGMVKQSATNEDKSKEDKKDESTKANSDDMTDNDLDEAEKEVDGVDKDDETTKTVGNAKKVAAALADQKKEMIKNASVKTNVGIQSITSSILNNKEF